MSINSRRMWLMQCVVGPNKPTEEVIAEVKELVSQESLIKMSAQEKSMSLMLYEKMTIRIDLDEEMDKKLDVLKLKKDVDEAIKIERQKKRVEKEKDRIVRAQWRKYCKEAKKSARKDADEIIKIKAAMKGVLKDECAKYLRLKAAIQHLDYEAKFEGDGEGAADIESDVVCLQCNEVFKSENKIKRRRCEKCHKKSRAPDTFSALLPFGRKTIEDENDKIYFQERRLRQWK